MWSLRSASLRQKVSQGGDGCRTHADVRICGRLLKQGQCLCFVQCAGPKDRLKTPRGIPGLKRAHDLTLGLTALEDESVGLVASQAEQEYHRREPHAPIA